jgi:sugar/nucleoside kinase (ribokinase family)
MGCVGQDESGRRLEQQMENCLYQKNANLPTATCLILITDQARSMITNLGAANEFTIDHLNNSDNWLHVERAQIFYVPVRFLRNINV